MSTPGQVKEAKAFSGQTALMCGLIAAAVVAAVGTWVPLKLAGTAGVPANPIAAPVLLMQGKVQWSGWATMWLVLVAVVAATGCVGVWRWKVQRGKGKTRVDTAQRHLGRGKDIASLQQSAVEAKAARLGVVAPVVDPAVPMANRPFNMAGVPIGAELSSNRELRGSWEEMHVDIWGPRQGKSTARIIPAICEAPGPVLATENKRGNLDHTRLVREYRDENGVPTRKVWVFDPQLVAKEPPDWCWEPLADIHDEIDAEELAHHFAIGDDGEDAKKDPYFDPEGEDLLANLILASALAGESIIMVYRRIADRDLGHDAVKILQDNDIPDVASALNARLNYQPKQQDGIYGTALKMARCLRTRRVRPWISRTGPDDVRPQLDLDAFIRNNETLYCLSREGVGSVGPLVAALTAAACKAAERIATTSPGGRLPTPMLCALDEAANVVRWRELPKLYSHYGSRGIVIMTILQSWSQGIGVWGERGMKLLQSAGNVSVYGGNVKERAYLEDLSVLVGDYERTATNVSSRSGATDSVSRHTTKERILPASALAAWPRGRLLVQSAGNLPVIARAVPWMERPYADLINASLAEYSPEANTPTEEKVG